MKLISDQDQAGRNRRDYARESNSFVPIGRRTDWKRNKFFVRFEAARTQVGIKPIDWSDCGRKSESARHDSNLLVCIAIHWRAQQVLRGRRRIVTPEIWLANKRICILSTSWHDWNWFESKPPLEECHRAQATTKANQWAHLHEQALNHRTRNLFAFKFCLLLCVMKISSNNQNKPIRRVHLTQGIQRKVTKPTGKTSCGLQFTTELNVESFRT